MPLWVRYAHRGQDGFGVLDGTQVRVYDGDMFEAPLETSHTHELNEIKLLAPCVPSKMIALWNNFYALAAKLEVPTPKSPLYLLKANSSFLGPGEIIHRPRAYAGPVVYEGELAIVIGKRCKEISEDEAAAHIFGYTCTNDVTAAALIKENSTFDQWVRAKSFDEFGVFGPAISTDAKPEDCTVRTVLNGAERQNYPLSDMVIPPHKIVSQISHDMTLMPGDVICCGTSLGVGSMKGATNTIEVTIDGIGTLSNVFKN